MSKNYLLSIMLTATDKASGVFAGVADSAAGSFGRMSNLAATHRNELNSLANQAGITGGAIAGGLALAGNASAQYSKGLAEVATLSQKAADLTGQYRGELLSMSVEYAQSTEALTSALYDSVSAGIEAGKATEFVAEAAKLAVAGVTDVGTSTGLLAGLLNAYGASADEAGHYSDILFQTVKQGQTTIPQLATSLGKVAPSAALAGVSMEELGAAMGAITAVTRNSETAATGLVAVLRGIRNPSEEMAAALERAGYATGEAAIKAVGLTGVMKIAAEASGGSATAMGKLFQETEAYNTAAILAANNAQTVAANVEANAEAAGVAEAAFARMSKETAFAMGQAKSATKAAVIEIGASIIAMMAPFAKAGASVARFVAEHQWLAKTIAYGGTVIGGFLLTVAAFTKAFLLLEGVTRGIATAKTMFTAATVSATSATTTETAAIAANTAAKTGTATATSAAATAQSQFMFATAGAAQSAWGAAAANASLQTSTAGLMFATETEAMAQWNAAAAVNARTFAGKLTAAELTQEIAAHTGATLATTANTTAMGTNTVAKRANAIASATAGAAAKAAAFAMKYASVGVTAAAAFAIYKIQQLLQEFNKLYEESTKASEAYGQAEQVHRYRKFQESFQAKYGRQATNEEIREVEKAQGVEILTHGQRKRLTEDENARKARSAFEAEFRQRVGRDPTLEELPANALTYAEQQRQPTEMAIRSAQMMRQFEATSATAYGGGGYVGGPEQPMTVQIELDKGLIARQQREAGREQNWQLQVGYSQ